LPQAPAAPRAARARLLTVLACGLIVLVMAAAAALIGNLKQRALASKSRELTNLAMVLSEETERAFQALEGAQQDIADRIKERGGATPEAFDRLARGAEIFQLLEAKADSLTYVDALSVMDRDGRLLNFSRSRQVPRASVAARDYFQALRGDPAMDTYLSLPARNPSSGKWTLYLARKVRDAQGEMLGLLVGSMRVEYFEQFYEQIKAGDQTAIAMFRTDGRLLAGHPLRPDAIGRRLVALREGDHGLPVLHDGLAVETASAIDGVPRLAAAALQATYPVAMEVSVPMATVTASWRGDAWAIGAGAALLSLIIALCLVLGRRQIRTQYEIARAAYDMARCDTVTGLPNRLMFTEALTRRLAAPGEGQTAVMLIDLDAFKDVNEGLGHAVGDQALTTVAQRIRAAVAPEDLVARVGGDEFAVVRHPSDAAAAGALAGAIIAAVAQPWFVRNYRIAMDASVGITLFPNQGRDTGELLNNAEMALLCAKAEGRGQWRIFEAQMAQEQAMRRAAEKALRDALDTDGFELHFQPLVNTGSAQLEGFEALLRWREPGLGQLGASQLIAVAEETGLIVPLGKWVLETACAQAAAWPGEVRVAVNVSAWQFRSGELMDQVRGALRAANLPAERLELEITETVLLQNTAYIHATLDELRAMGVRIALDDFGTGYSSLLYLRRFPADRIKIDMAFVADVCTNAESARIVQAIVNLGHSLGMQTTGEGVESQAQWDQLRQAGCTEIQGYFVGRPCPPGEIRVYFEKYGVASAES